MKNIIKILAICTASLILPLFANAQSKDPAKPNILLVIAEDCSYNDIGCYGNTDVKTPNIDVFAKQAVRYTNAFTTGAVCSASRSALITGMYQTAIGAQNHRTLTQFKKPLPDEVFPITKYIREAGYLPILCAHDDPKFGKTNPGPWGSGKTDFNFKFPEKEIFDAHNWNQAKPGQPFFGYLTLLSTHRGKWWNEETVRPGGVNPDSLKTIPPYYPLDDVSRKDFAAYYDAVGVVDKNFGEIIERLKNGGVLDNTIVVFMSDHGRPMPRDKQFCWDEGIHVPLLIRYPNAKNGGTINDKLVSSIDISAQIIEWTGAKIPSHIQGVPFTEENKSERKYIVSARDRCDETVHRIRTIRTKDFLYIRNFDPEQPFTAPNLYKDTRYPILINERKLFAEGKLPENCKPFFAPQKPLEELYDMRIDPHCLNNIVTEKKQSNIVHKMRKYLNEWLIKYPDNGAIQEPKEVMDKIMEQRIKEYGKSSANE